MNKRQQLGQLVRDNMERFNLFDMGWEYGYDQAKKRLGCCNYTKKLLTFSLPFVDLNSIDAMEDTVLHEIAHALAGSRAKHGIDWRMVARCIGATPRACNADPNIIIPSGDYSFTCKCTTHYFHRANVLGSRRRCLKCGHRGIIQKSLDNCQLTQ